MEKSQIKKDVKKVLQRGNHITALFLASGDFQEPVLEVLKELKMKVPDDISIVTFDEVPGISEENSLTVIEQPLKEIGKVSTEKILESRREKKHKRFKVILEPKLIMRNSVRRQEKKSLWSMRQAYNNILAIKT